MPASLGMRINKEKFKDPNWYTSLAVDLLDFNWGGVAKELSKALKSANKSVAKQISEVFVTSFNDALIYNEIDVSALNYKPEYADLFITGKIDPSFPSYHPLFSILLNEYKEARKCGDFSPLDLVAINDMRMRFSSFFTSYINNNLTNFPEVKQYFSVLEQNIPSESLILRELNEVLFEIEHAPLSIDQRMTLLQTYVSPTCLSKESDNFKESQDCLIKELIRLIESDTHPIVIHGQPGHGKTSAVKMLFRTICGLYAPVAAPPIPLLFEFKHLHDLNRSAIGVLQERANFIDNEDFFFGRNTILILDGLDERQAADGGSDDFLRSFIRDLFALARRVNADATGRLNLVLTGRSQYVGQIKSAFTGQYSIVEIQDFDESQQKIWLNRFQKQTHEELEYKQFADNKLSELVGQPILLVISALLLSDKEGKKLLAAFSGKQVNRAMIYKTIIEWAYNKQWHKVSYLESWKDDISLENYFTLLQAIAFEMYRTGDETIRLSDLSKALKENAHQIFQLECIGDKWLDNLEELLKQLRISFFFTGVEDKAFSFIHKSVKDFLIASGLVDASKSLFQDFNPRRPERTDDELVALFGAMELSIEDHCGFLREWLAIRQEQLAEVREQAYQISRRVITREFSINDVREAHEQNRKLAIVTHNLLQMVSRWFSQTKRQFSDEEEDSHFSLLNGSEQKEVGLMLLANNLVLNTFDNQVLSELMIFGKRSFFSLVSSRIHDLEIIGQVRLLNARNAKCDRIFVTGGVEFSDLSGSGVFEIIVIENVPPYFYQCDFSGRTISIGYTKREPVSKVKLVNCNLDKVHFYSTNYIDIIEEGNGFQPLNLNIQ